MVLDAVPNDLRPTIAGRTALLASAQLAALALSACVARPAVPPPPSARVPDEPVLDASYDWRSLLVVPFDTVHKEIPFPLHEVLMFRDASHSLPAEDADCYAPERPPPRFLTRLPSEYVMCFEHDRLARVQATVNLPRAEAARTFGAACALWRRNGDVSDAAGGAPEACDGRGGAIRYSARLDAGAERAEVPVTINLEAAVQP